jgi:hypothetical protein
MTQPQPPTPEPDPEGHPVMQAQPPTPEPDPEGPPLTVAQGPTPRSPTRILATPYREFTPRSSPLHTSLPSS